MISSPLKTRKHQTPKKFVSSIPGSTEKLTLEESNHTVSVFKYLQNTEEIEEKDDDVKVSSQTTVATVVGTKDQGGIAEKSTSGDMHKNASVGTAEEAKNVSTKGKSTGNPTNSGLIHRGNKWESGS
ncbi:uncharacterized protein LOC132623666 isoform X2 [Lycium barbarum]|uniref:uncharacterized protein LOC132623666 isoform X2 n=1 Tax=Lycium barbarum TaxID=112863 RepID=UPI00293E85BB|nr:uncharacterized protein LOC132623666 isoform X2 [Lycium barbarum]